MKSQPRSYEILLSEGPKKTYQEIREELDQKQRVMQDTHQKIIFNRKENLKKNIEEVQEIQKIYTYGYRKNGNSNIQKTNSHISNSAGGLSKSLNFLSNSTKKNLFNSSTKIKRETLTSGKLVKNQGPVTENTKIGVNSFLNLISPNKNDAILAIDKLDCLPSSQVGQFSQISSSRVIQNQFDSSQAQSQSQEEKPLKKLYPEIKISRPSDSSKNNINVSSSSSFIKKINETRIRTSSENFFSAKKPTGAQNLISNFKLSIKNNPNTNDNHKRNTENFISSKTNNFGNLKNKQHFRGSSEISEIKKNTSPFDKTKNLKNNKFSFLMVSPEDEVFDQYQHDEFMIAKTKKPFLENIPKLDSVTKKLFKVYRLDYDYLKGVQKAKSRKNDLDLENYQNNLVQVVGSRFSKESMRKLIEKLKQVRLVSNKIKKEDSIEKFIENIEKVEEEIISNLMRKEEKLEFLRGNKLTNTNVPLPKIKYKRIRKVSITELSDRNIEMKNTK